MCRPLRGGENASASGGAVAQLGERLNGIQEVGGSTPLGSTTRIKDLVSQRATDHSDGVTARVTGGRPA
jgi:hypothetical protein